MENVSVALEVPLSVYVLASNGFRVVVLSKTLLKLSEVLANNTVSGGSVPT